MQRNCYYIKSNKPRTIQYYVPLMSSKQDQIKPDKLLFWKIRASYKVHQVTECTYMLHMIRFSNNAFLP